MEVGEGRISGKDVNENMKKIIAKLGYTSTLDYYLVVRFETDTIQRTSGYCTKEWLVSCPFPSTFSLLPSNLGSTYLSNQSLSWEDMEATSLAQAGSS